MDIGSVGVIVLGIVSILIAGLVDEYLDLSANRCLQIGFVSTFIVSFFSMNALLTVNEMRFVVAAFTASFLIPYFTTFFMTWIYVSKPSITRVQYVTYVSWLGTLVFTILLRGILGWGVGDQLIVNIIFAVFLSFADGILGGIVSIFLLSQLERFRPSIRQLQ